MRVDKMLMATSVEGREPFLDHHLVEFAMALPPEQKVRDGVGKMHAQAAVDGLLPHDLIYRKKRASAPRSASGSAASSASARSARSATRRSPSAGCIDYDRVDEMWAAHRARPGVELPALEPLQRLRLARLLGRRARAGLAACSADAAPGRAPRGTIRGAHRSPTRPGPRPDGHMASLRARRGDPRGAANRCRSSLRVYARVPVLSMCGRDDIAKRALRPAA